MEVTPKEESYRESPWNDTTHHNGVFGSRFFVTRTLVYIFYISCYLLV